MEVMAEVQIMFSGSSSSREGSGIARMLPEEDST